jgi:triacylglycerol esterase/lipase EstA (alpha/beta hydrolase family)
LVSTLIVGGLATVSAAPVGATGAAGRAGATGVSGRAGSVETTGAVPDGAAQAVTSSGWNDWSCRPSAAHPDPVVLLHGFGGDGTSAWTRLAPYLADAGWCVFSLTYGRAEPLGLLPFGGVGPLADSAEEISGFMDQVLDATGAPEVDLIGHSEGGILALYVTKVLGRAGDVGTVVTLGTGVKGDEQLGTDDIVDAVETRAVLEALSHGLECHACTDLLAGSAVRQALNEGPVAQPGVSYTLIFTLIDEFHLLFDPTVSPFLREPGVRNRYVQTTCPLDLAGHSQLPYSRSVAGMVHEALDPDGAPPIRCGVGIPLG